MGGFSAIASNNGWVIALLGISIVFAGLVSLAVIISLFAQVLNWWNKKSYGASVQQFRNLLTRPRKEKGENTSRQS
jgi:hypothetical protein